MKLFQKQPSHNILIGFSDSPLGTKEKALIAGIAEAEGIHKLWPDIEHEYLKKLYAFFTNKNETPGKRNIHKSETPMKFLISVHARLLEGSESADNLVIKEDAQ